MPAYVSKQTGLTPIPRGPLNEEQTKKFIIDLRKSEIKKDRAIRYTLAERRLLVDRWAQPANRGWTLGSKNLRWPGDGQ